MKFAHNADFATAQPLKLSLQDELQAWGVDVIPATVVHKHMRDTIAKHRVGVYVHLGPLVYAMSLIHNAIVSNQRYAMLIIGSLLVPPIVSFIAALMGILWAWPVFVFASVFIITLTIFDYVVIDRGKPPSDFLKAAMIWSRVTIETQTLQQLRSWGIPDHLMPRVQRAGWVSGVRVRKLRFGPDPIIEVSRTGFFFVERVHIGGWETGVPEIDNF
jgi:hypothetical protein